MFIKTNQANELIFTKQSFYDFVKVKSKKYQRIRLESLHKILSIYSKDVKKDDMSYLSSVTRNELIKIDIDNKIYNLPKDMIYGSINIDIFYKIIKQNNSNISLDKIFLFYAHYKKRMIKRKPGVNKIQTHPKIFYDFIENISNELQLSVVTVNKIIKLLVELDIIRTTKITTFPSANGWVNGKTIFTDYINNDPDYSWKDELKYGEKYVISLTTKEDY